MQEKFYLNYLFCKFAKEIKNMNDKTRKIIGIWLLIGLVMVIVQVILGGITRLTDSGLSITEWNVVKGILPPLNEADWRDFLHTQIDTARALENASRAISARLSRKVTPTVAITLPCEHSTATRHPLRLQVT